MTVSLFIWLAVAAILTLLIVVRIITDYSDSRHNTSQLAATSRHRFKLVEIGKEHEEFFIPGDNCESNLTEGYDSTIN